MNTPPPTDDQLAEFRIAYARMQLRIELAATIDILILEQLALRLGLDAPGQPHDEPITNLTATLHHAAETRRIMRALLRKLGGQARLTHEELNAPRDNMVTLTDGDGSMWISIGPTPTDEDTEPANLAGIINDLLTPEPQPDDTERHLAEFRIAYQRMQQNPELAAQIDDIIAATWHPGDPIHTPPTPKTCTHCGTTWNAEIDTCPECNATWEEPTTTH